MSSLAHKNPLRPEDYLALERLATGRSEYHDGRIYAMAGASRVHGLLAANLSRHLGNQFDDRGCELYIADMRVSVEATGLYAYPDIAIICGTPSFLDGKFDTLLNPTVIIEVLSPSTESWDRGGKFAHFRRIESLTDYVLVSQDKILVEHYTRQGEQWLLTAWSRPADSLVIDSIGCSVPLADIYARVTFDPDQTSAT